MHKAAVMAAITTELSVVGADLIEEPIYLDPSALSIEQPTPITGPALAHLDVTDCVGATVDPDTWLWLQAEVQRRYAGAWILHADQVGGEFMIRRLTAKPE